MRFLSRFVVCAVALVATARFGEAQTPASPNVIYACVGDLAQFVRIVSGPNKCVAGEKIVEWNVVGVAGPQGPQGPMGLSARQDRQALSALLAPRERLARLVRREWLVPLDPPERMGRRVLRVPPELPGQSVRLGLRERRVRSDRWERLVRWALPEWQVQWDLPVRPGLLGRPVRVVRPALQARKAPPARQRFLRICRRSQRC